MGRGWVRVARGWVSAAGGGRGNYRPHCCKSYDDRVPEHHHRTRDTDLRQRPAVAAGLAVPGAFFALLAALAGISAHGLASPTSLSHAPSFDALFLLTAGAASLGAGAGVLLGLIGRLASVLPALAGRVLAVAANPRALGLVLPVTAGQWFAHAVLEADHRIAAAGASGAGTAGSAGASGAGAAGIAGGHAGHGAAAQGLAGALSAGSAHHGGGDTGMVFSMVAAHAAGVLACVVVSIIARRALGRLVGFVVAALPRPRVAVAARVDASSDVIGVGVRGFAPAAPRAPPLLFALAA